jgi:alpha-glucoside transport system substrate-binding protein
VLLAACSTATGVDPTASPSASTTDPECADYASYGAHPGTTVSVLAPVATADRKKFEAAWQTFERCTAITVRYAVGSTIESQLVTSTPSAGRPDIAFVGQPRLLQELVSTGAVKKAPAAVAANVDRFWNPVWASYGTVNDTFYAAPLGATMKSLVWYSPTVFAAKGYAVPTTWAGLWTLSERMASDGMKPWCGGLAAGAATGWPATDWLEETVLRQSGGDVYDQWISHDVKFDSPAITEAMDQVALWMKNSRFVNAGIGPVASIATTTVDGVGRPILDGTCGMLQMPSSYASQWSAFKSGVRLAADGDVFAFYLPSIDPAQNAVEATGDFVAAFADRPEVQQFQAFLSSATFATERVRLGGWVSANSGVDPTVYRDAISGLSARHLTDPSALVRLDASEQMPAEVGSGAAFAQLTDWFAVNKPTKDVLDAIDLAWPTS